MALLILTVRDMSFKIGARVETGKPFTETTLTSISKFYNNLLTANEATVQRAPNEATVHSAPNEATVQLLIMMKS